MKNRCHFASFEIRQQINTLRTFARTFQKPKPLTGWTAPTFAFFSPTGVRREPYVLGSLSKRLTADVPPMMCSSSSTWNSSSRRQRRLEILSPSFKTPEPLSFLLVKASSSPTALSTSEGQATISVVKSSPASLPNISYYSFRVIVNKEKEKCIKVWRFECASVPYQTILCRLLRSLGLLEILPSYCSFLTESAL